MAFVDRIKIRCNSIGCHYIRFLLVDEERSNRDSTPAVETILSQETPLDFEIATLLEFLRA
jgi:hypothetical protein